MTTVAQDRHGRRERLARGHLPVLDAYRAVAATAVVVTHVGFQTGVTLDARWGALVSRLDIGVALFFALSGFLLFRTWAVALAGGGRGPRTAGYLWHRALRILPAYWVVVVVALVALPLNDGADRQVWLANLSLTQIYVPQTLTHGLTQMWSLATEVAFYLVLPVLGLTLLAAARRWGSWLRWVGVTAGVLVAVNIAWTAWVHSSGPGGLRAFWLPSYTSWFAVGILLAALAAHLAAGGGLPAVARPLLTLADRPGSCWTMAGGLMLVASTPLAGPRAFEWAPDPRQAVLKNLLYAVIVGLVLLPATVGHPGGRFHRALSTPLLRRLGDISYGVFLWHLLVLAAVFAVSGRETFTGGFAPVLLATVVGSFAVAELSWSLLERPVLRLKSRVPM